jgi:parvulin-like peptidyl-prolyl isomerase
MRESSGEIFMANQGSNPKATTKKHIARLARERQQVQLIRAIAIGGIILVALLLGYGYFNLNYFQLQEAVVEVNGKKITIGQWQERVQLQRINLLNQYQQMAFYQQNFGFDTSQQQQQILFSLQNDQILGQEVLDLMVDEELVRQEAEKRGITVSEAELEEELQSAFQFFPNGTPTPTLTPTEFSYPTLSSEQLLFYPSTATPTVGPTSTTAPTSTKDPSVTPTVTATTAPPTPTFVPEAATATATPYTLDGYQTSYKETLENLKTSGISEATIRAVYEAELLRKKLLTAIGSEASTTQEQVWLRHILAPDERTLGIVQSLLAAGWDFDEVAKKYSSDTGSASNGGEYSWQPRGFYVPEFEEAAFSQPIGEIGKPVKTEFGYHIIQVIAREEVPANATQIQQASEAKFTEWLETARAESAIIANEVWMERIPELPPSFSQEQPQ